MYIQLTRKPLRNRIHTKLYIQRVGTVAFPFSKISVWKWRTLYFPVFEISWKTKPAGGSSLAGTSPGANLLFRTDTKKRIVQPDLYVNTKCVFSNWKVFQLQFTMKFLKKLVLTKFSRFTKSQIVCCLHLLMIFDRKPANSHLPWPMTSFSQG